MFPRSRCVHPLIACGIILDALTPITHQILTDTVCSLSRLRRATFSSLHGSWHPRCLLFTICSSCGTSDITAYPLGLLCTLSSICQLISAFSLPPVNFPSTLFLTFPLSCPPPQLHLYQTTPCNLSSLISFSCSFSNCSVTLSPPGSILLLVSTASSSK